MTSPWVDKRRREEDKARGDRRRTSPWVDFTWRDIHWRQAVPGAAEDLIFPPMYI